ncbi:MAG: hypothetical protein R3C59_09815 [Planctomycetaceae bacterium]
MASIAEQNGNGNGQVAADGKPHVQSNSVFAGRHVFEPFDSGDLKPPEFTREAQSKLFAVPPALVIPLQKIRYALAERSSAVESVRRLALATFDADGDRREQRIYADKAIVAIDEMLISASADRDRWDDALRHAPLIRQVPIADSSSLWQRLPAISLLLFWLSLFVFGLFAELRNGLFLVEGSGIGFFNDPAGAICFACVYVLAPLVVFKFARHRLNGDEESRFRTRLKKIAVPAVVAGVTLFGLKMGLMHEAVDVFAEDGNWQPPLWTLITTSMLLLAVTVLILPVFVAGAAERIWHTEPVEGRLYAMASDRFNRRKSVLREWLAARSHMESLLKEQESERSAFVVSCLSELKRFQAELTVRTNQIRGQAFLADPDLPTSKEIHP